MSEIRLRQTVKNFLSDQRYRTFDEPYFLSRRIDVIGIRESYRNVVAVELKLFRWRYALVQAYLNTRVASYSYVALPEEKYDSVDDTEFKKLGIGLLTVGSIVKEVIQPHRSRRIQHFLRKKFITNLLHGD